MQRMFILISMLVFKPALSQKLYGIVNLTSPFSGISHSATYNKLEFQPSIARINFSWRFDLLYNSGTSSIWHNIHFEEIPFGVHFKIINKFLRTGDTLYGYKYATFGYFIDYYSLGYSLIKEGKKNKKFLFHSKVRFTGSAGVAISLNRSQKYYDSIYAFSGDGFSSPSSYIEGRANHYREGFGLFADIEAGAWLLSRLKNKRILKLSLFYRQGFKDMISHKIHYRYGYFNDPSKQVDVADQKVLTKGTTFGFNLGFPINIIK